MALCFQKHPFEIETEDRLTAINTKIFEIKKKIQLSDGQRKSYYEEYEAEKKRNSELIESLKTEIKLRLNELREAQQVLGGEDAIVKKYLNDVGPIGNKTADEVIHNLDLKVIEQRKILDLLKYEIGSKKKKLKELEKEYEKLLIESTKSDLVKSKLTTRSRKHISHLENEIHTVLIQWTEAELVKKKYASIRQALIEDSVRFESSLAKIEELLEKQNEEITKLKLVRDEAAAMRLRATAATAAEAARAHDAEHARAAERAFYAQRFEERRRELEKLEKRIFPPAVRPVRQESTGSMEGEPMAEEISPAQQMEDIFQKLMKLTGVTEPEQVFDRFRGQRETSTRLAYLQQTTEQEKLQLEETQTALMAELEGYKFASVKDKDEGQDEIQNLKAEIKEEEEARDLIQKELEGLESFLLEMKRLLYDLCKMLDVVGEPAMPEWTAEACDIQEILAVLTTRFEKAQAKVETIGDKHNSTVVFIPSNTTSGAPSVANMSARSHSSQKESDKIVPTYKELVQKEPGKVIVSDEEEDIPSRCYLKRQAQLIVDTKCRRKGFRPPYPRK
ncbi:putative golgin subfamily A member 6-like protein 3 [Pieris rapae]|uniref:putative golgin subfamily A member 6-like protein 3 n=1 Tax=Pieris rapae TaxID=64459 RepID=UPI001E280C57|nr:putative golgin subfamily A member 6-like protein 3 [Pieris rapae]